jgi:hypothetical protein
MGHLIFSLRRYKRAEIVELSDIPRGRPGLLGRVFEASPPAAVRGLRLTSDGG